MAMRLKTKWANQEKERTIEEIASALAFTVWRIAMQGVLNLENENFQTDTQSQRIDIAEEFAIFMIHLTDRMSYEELSNKQRMAFIKALALKMAEYDEDNRQETDGADGDHGNAFISLLNQRMEDYSDCTWSVADGPGFSMTRTFGDHVTSRVGERDRKWVTTYVQDIETPEAEATLKKALKALMGWEL
jgi:hypothetical protein